MNNRLIKFSIFILLLFTGLVFISCGGVKIETPYDFFECLNNIESNQTDERIINVFAEKLLLNTKDSKIDYSNSEAELTIKGEDVSGKYYLQGNINNNGIDTHIEINGESLNEQFLLSGNREETLEGKKYNTQHLISKLNLFYTLSEESKLGDEDVYDNLILVLDKLTKDYKTSSFIKDTYNKLFHLEETSEQFIIKLNYNGIKSYIVDLFTKPINDHLLKIFDKETIDYEEFVDEYYDMTVKEFINFLHKKDIEDDELVTFLDNYASIKTDKSTTFAKYIKNKLKLNIETDDTKEILSNKEFLNLQLGKDIIKENKRVIKNLIRSKVNSSILELIMDDYTVEEYDLIRKTLVNKISIIMDMLKDNLIFEMSFDKEINFIDGLIELDYDFTNLSKYEMFDEIVKSELKLDIKLKLDSVEKFEFESKEFFEDKELIDKLSFKKDEIKFKSLDNAEYKIEPEYKNGVLAGFYYFYPRSYWYGITYNIIYYPINIDDITYVMDCNCIMINLNYPVRTVYNMNLQIDSSFSTEKKYNYAKRKYNTTYFSNNNSIGSIYESGNYSYITSKTIIYYPETNEIDFNVDEKTTLHNLTLNKEESIYNYNCEMKSYNVYTCTKCDKKYLLEGKTLHANKLLGKVNLEYYGIYDYSMEFWGCDVCNKLDYLPNPKQIYGIHEIPIDLKTSLNNINGIKTGTFDFYSYKKKILSIEYEYSEDELIVYVNYNKETNVGDRIFRFSGILNK